MYAPSDRDWETGDLFDVLPGSVTIIPISDSNDNLQIAEITYSAILKSCFR